jgi:hypothetical protein
MPTQNTITLCTIIPSSDCKVGKILFSSIWVNKLHVTVSTQVLIL